MAGRPLTSGRTITISLPAIEKSIGNVRKQLLIIKKKMAGVAIRRTPIEHRR
jgi:hypothetical protein